MMSEYVLKYKATRGRHAWCVLTRLARSGNIRIILPLPRHTLRLPFWCAGGKHGTMLHTKENDLVDLDKRKGTDKI
jgi:hypothetical protein